MVGVQDSANSMELGTTRTRNDKEEEEEEEHKEKLLYGVEEVPSWSTTILFGIQQVLVCSSAVVAMPIVIAEILCAGNNDLARVKLIGTLTFTTGLSTLIQTTFGTRLPLLQGPAFTFLPPIIAMMNMPENKCPAQNSTAILTGNATWDTSEAWMDKMQIVQGGLIVGSIVEMLLGLTGIIGLITKFVGPLTIAPVMILLEVSIAKVCADYAVQHWMSAVMVALLIIVALYMHGIRVPLPRLNGRKCETVRFPLFAIFPYLIAISIAWLLCLIFTATNVFDNEHHKVARTDVRAQAIIDAPWFRWPYPFQWGWPQWNTGLILGMVAATLASLTESIGNYHACARASEVPPPPLHAVNRGILMEGLCCLIGATLGGGTSVTTYSENVGVIGITKVASRRTMQAAGVVLLLLGLFTKVGAVLATIPNPLVGGILTVSIAMVGGVGMTSLQMIDLSLSRNSAILGFAVMCGILIPDCFTKAPLRTGNDTADQVLNILLTIQMFVAGVVGFVLDNTIPGATKRQRGLISGHGIEKSIDKRSKDERSFSLDVYSFPPRVTAVLNKIPCVKYLPFMPSFQNRVVKL